ncbi:lysozyme inhibitor LprI family protein [Chitinilyticum litopenaei]|uniref:lysozyme inhibitor LprI family protein n=1 Tax=Chitinilyticum litopenaei TaxID=1121276 RepID=UPI0004265B25|nr:lysozyme inhibitor LprI family protein [Chitinilyticum litopenaei]
MTRLFAVLLCIGAAPAWALDCQKAVTTPEIEQCARSAQEKTEQKLNAVYRSVLKQIDALSKNPDTPEQAGLKKQFVDAQRLWVKFREADCQAVYTYWSGGSVRGTMYLGCMQARAEQRISELQELVEEQ